MIQKFIKKNNSKHLSLLFTGWGMDEQPLEDVALDDDILVCYDYTNLDLDASLLLPYSTIRLIGWSMGVWAASYFISKGIIKPQSSVAINGTIFPVDDERGINSAIFHATHDGLNPATFKKFQRRMCQDKETIAQFSTYEQRRTIDELRDELRMIEKRASETEMKDVIWDMAIIGERDMIFTFDNQINGWEGHTKKVVMKDIPHYSKEILVDAITCATI